MWYTWRRGEVFMGFCKWENNIKMVIREIGINGANWIQLAQYNIRWLAFVSTVMNLWVP
jgi:hypothetical protein